jgi:hypothetical protein
VHVSPVLLTSFLFLFCFFLTLSIDACHINKNLPLISWHRCAIGEFLPSGADKDAGVILFRIAFRPIAGMALTGSFQSPGRGGFLFEVCSAG